MEDSLKENKLTIGRIIFTLVYILIFPLGLIFLSGDWFWIKGWFFNIWFIIIQYEYRQSIIKRPKNFENARTQPPGPVDFVDPASGILLRAKEGGVKLLSPSLQSREGLG